MAEQHIVAVNVGVELPDFSVHLRSRGYKKNARMFMRPWTTIRTLTVNCPHPRWIPAKRARRATNFLGNILNHKLMSGVTHIVLNNAWPGLEEMELQTQLKSLISYANISSSRLQPFLAVQPSLVKLRVGVLPRVLLQFLRSPGPPLRYVSSHIHPDILAILDPQNPRYLDRSGCLEILPKMVCDEALKDAFFNRLSRVHGPRTLCIPFYYLSRIPVDTGAIVGIEFLFVTGWMVAFESPQLKQDTDTPEVHTYIMLHDVLISLCRSTRRLSSRDLQDGIS